jgi:hypothetical protein
LDRRQTGKRADGWRKIALALLDRIEVVNASIQTHASKQPDERKRKSALSLGGQQGVAQQVDFWRPFAPCFA